MHSLRRCPSALLQALPRITDQRHGDTSIDGAFDDKRIDDVHVERLINDEVAVAAAQTCSGGAERGVGILLQSGTNVTELDAERTNRQGPGPDGRVVAAAIGRRTSFV